MDPSAHPSSPADASLRRAHAALLWADPDAPPAAAMALARSIATRPWSSASPPSRRAILCAASLLGDPLAEGLAPPARAAWMRACQDALGEGGCIAIHGEAASAGDDLSWAYGRSSDPEAFLDRLAQGCGPGLWEPKAVAGSVEAFEASLAERMACKAAGHWMHSGPLSEARLFRSSAGRLGRFGRWAAARPGLDPTRCAGALRDSASLMHFPEASRGQDARLLRQAFLGLFGAGIEELRRALAGMGALEAHRALGPSAEEAERGELSECLDAPLDGEAGRPGEPEGDPDGRGSRGGGAAKGRL